MNSFIEGYKQQLKEDFEKFTTEITPIKVLRISDLKLDAKDILERLNKNNVKLRKISYLKYGYEYEASFPIASMPEYLIGHIYLQDAPSQLTVEILDPKEDEIILDMCSAPGSKTTYMAQLMKNKGKIVAIDKMPIRLNALHNNIERLGIKNIITYQMDAQYISDFNIKFDKVLLDAPCSGNFIIEENWFTKRTKQDIEEIQILQKKLLKEAVKVTKDNGIVIYSTCSLEKAEDEDVIEWALKNLPVTLEEIENENQAMLKGTVKFWPHKTKTQGFFIAKLKINRK